MILLILSQASLILGRRSGRLHAGRSMWLRGASIERGIISSIPLLNLSAVLSSSWSPFSQLIFTMLLGTLLIFSVTGATPACAADGPLLVAAASDLAELEPALASAWEKAGGARVRFITGASGMLARQVENGAPYDIFLSANERFVTELVRAGKIVPGSVRVYASGRLGLWSRSGKIRELRDLTPAGVKRVAIANPAHAPYGAAAKQLLERSGFWRQLESKIVFGENVRQAYEFAASGNADAAITSWTLIYQRGGVLLPAAMYNPIHQAGGAITGSGREAEARRFLDFLVSPAVQHLLQSHGLGAR